MSKSEHPIIGYEFSTVSNILNGIYEAREAGYARYVVPVAHPRYKREFYDQVVIESQGDNFSRSLVAVYTQNIDYVASIIGRLSDYVNVDCEDDEKRKIDERTFDQEIKWCIYLAIQFVIVPLPMNGSITNLARLIYAKLKVHHTSPTFFMRVPMVSYNTIAPIYRGDEIPECDAWKRWNSFRTYCGSEKKLKLALEVTNDLPNRDDIDRWLGEPIGVIILRTKTFITNAQGFPVLSKAHQELINVCLRRNIQIIISGSVGEDRWPLYQQYIHHLWQNIHCTGLYHEYVHGYEDFLQIPLQPLMDNLDRYTYEIFEKDPVKYREYERGIYLALLDRKKEDNDEKPLVVMVVGAGRGPLVNASLNASQKANVKIKLYAIEKNPHAIISLQSQKLDKWKDQVTIIATDMRKWKAPEKADIIISELLGSFGDNELSPECLDGAQNFLKDDGISIPSSYSSYICPTQTHKIYAEITDFVDREKPYYHRYEQPYVVHLQTVYHLAPVKKLFTFDHPNRDDPIDNSRYKKLTFEATQDSVIHGFSGFFDAVLYKDVKLSIVPETFSEGMFSWFPIFFPVREPVQVKKGEIVEISIWRLLNEKIVWYEWLISSPVAMSVHNPNGRTYFIGLT